jgi:rare lipoprotein A
MSKNLSVLLLAAALALLAGCTTTPTSPAMPSGSPNATGAGASTSPSGPDSKTSSAPSAPLPLDIPDNLTGNLGTSTSPPGGPALREVERGQASWYGPRFHGRRTASGERYDQHAMTAAHKTLPFGTLVRVRSLVTGKEVDVRVTDRGPFVRGRIIDVSRAAAEALGMMGLGVKQVSLHVASSGSSLIGASRLPGMPTRPARFADSPAGAVLLSDRLDYLH